MSTTETVQPRPYLAPSPWSTLLELTAVAEMIGFWASRAVLQKLLPKGDGHAVMVIPAFMTTDSSTVALREFLLRLGYDAQPWSLGRNPGICSKISARVQDRISCLADRSGRRVSLIGWSAGGLYARVVAHERHESVRQVVTLGTPFGIDFANNNDGLVGRFQRFISDDTLTPDAVIKSGYIHRSPPVPSTSIISRRDGFANWKYSLDVGGAHTENISVPTSHLAMTRNPFVVALIAERLSQPEGAWKPFTPTSLNKAFFRRACARNEIPQAVVGGPRSALIT